MGLPGKLLKVGDHSTRDPSPSLTWVPIRSLAERHRPCILAHLVALPDADRYLRFGYAASDAQLAHYADLIDFSRDEVFGIFNRRLDLIAMAHLASLPASSRGPRGEAEFGVSVLPKARCRGHGSRLFERAALHARNCHVDTLIIHALSQNTAMLRIARKAGAQVERDGGDSQARLRLPPDDLKSHWKEILQAQAAEFNYRFKSSARRFEGLLDGIDEVKDRFARAGGAASE